MSAEIRENDDDNYAGTYKRIYYYARRYTARGRVRYR